MSITIPVITEYVGEIAQPIIIEPLSPNGLTSDNAELLSDDENNFITYGA